MKTAIRILTNESNLRQYKVDSGKYSYKYNKQLETDVYQIDKAISVLTKHLEVDFKTCNFCVYYEREEQFCQSKKSGVTFVNGTHKCKYFKSK